jgi:hypothetical protein
MIFDRRLSRPLPHITNEQPKKMGRTQILPLSYGKQCSSLFRELVQRKIERQHIDTWLAEQPQLAA